MLSEQEFIKPSNNYRPIPFWFWNSKLRKEDIEAQIRDFYNKGLGGFFIHARFGLETEYLSREWMNCVKIAINEAEKLGMEVWLYDENGFPSGIGDLKVSRIKEYRPKFIDLTEGCVEAGKQIELNLPSGEVLMAYAYPQNSNQESEKIDITNTVFENKLIWDAPDGDWHVAVYSKCTIEDKNDVVYGVDYLNPEAMRYFFDYTLDPYERAVGEHFGRTIKGIFTDEPTLLPWHHDINWYGKRKHTRVIVWDDLIANEMLCRNHMEVSEFLPHMFFDVDEKTPDIRRAFWRCVSDLYVKAYFEPYKKWCESHNLLFTGHVLFEEGLYINTDFQADITASLAKMDIPGADFLGTDTDVPYGGSSNLPTQLTNVQGEKLVSSLAHVLGKNSVISETYGCCGWSLNYQTMKRLADFQYCHGINMLCPHAMFYSIEGFRKTDAPPSENHMAGWDYYKQFSDYIGRISYVLRSGRHSSKIALLYPLSDFWGKHVVGAICEDDKAVSDSFDLCASCLLKLHLDYDIITEKQFAGTKIENGCLVLNEEKYDILISPPGMHDNSAVDKLEQYLEDGGMWVISPLSCKDANFCEIQAQIPCDCSFSDINNDEYAVFEHKDGKILAIIPGTDNHSGIMASLDGAVRSLVDPDVEITRQNGELLPEIRYIKRIDESKHIFFIANSSEENINCSIRLNCCGSIEEWNPENGSISKPQAKKINNRLILEKSFAPCGSTIYVVDTDSDFEPAMVKDKSRVELFVFPDEWQFKTLNDNVLILDGFKFTPETNSSGAKYIYETSFDCEYVPDNIKLVLDDIEYRSSLMGGMDIQIDLNGNIWHNPAMYSYIDKGFKTLDISGAVNEGENKLKVTIIHSAWSGQPHLLNAPMALLGNFSYYEQKNKILKPIEAAFAGSWTEFGYPYYSGTALYTHSFRLPKYNCKSRLIISIDSLSDMAEIFVNEQAADIRVWQPWEADITDFVKKGTNTLSIKITNTMANVFDKEPRKSGLTGRVRLFEEVSRNDKKI